MRVACVAGARPNFMKIKPVIDGLDAAGLTTDLVHTGQHYDQAMSGVFFDDLGLRSPDVHLEVGSGRHGEQTGRVMAAFEEYIDDRRPEAVVVVGDVNSTMACAIVAAKAGPLVAHVEAGLRSRDWAMPEEVNRLVTDRVSDLLLAPSPDAVQNLLSEAYRPDQIHLVGNVMIDTLRTNVERARNRNTLSDLGLEGGDYGVVTLHRPSNVDQTDPLQLLLDALAEVSTQLPLVLPAHPRLAQQLKGCALPGSIRVIEPLGYLDFLCLQAGARIVLTDSGGIQEETTALGVPCLTLRENTERPITITEGTNRLVGTDPTNIIAAATETLASPPPPRCPALWDGHAGERIAAVLSAALASGFRRPTEEVTPV